MLHCDWSIFLGRQNKHKQTWSLWVATKLTDSFIITFMPLSLKHDPENHKTFSRSSSLDGPRVSVVRLPYKECRTVRHLFQEMVLMCRCLGLMCHFKGFITSLSRTVYMHETKWRRNRWSEAFIIPSLKEWKETRCSWLNVVWLIARNVHP